MLVIWLSGLLAAIGHSFLWASFVNQVHARGWPKSIIKWLSWPAILVVMPLGCLQWLYRCWYSESLDQLWNSNQGNYLYDVLCLDLVCGPYRVGSIAGLLVIPGIGPHNRLPVSCRLSAH